MKEGWRLEAGQSSRWMLWPGGNLVDRFPPLYALPKQENQEPALSSLGGSWRGKLQSISDPCRLLRSNESPPLPLSMTGAFRVLLWYLTKSGFNLGPAQSEMILFSHLARPPVPSFDDFGRSYPISCDLGGDGLPATLQPTWRVFIRDLTGKGGAGQDPP